MSLKFTYICKDHCKIAHFNDFYLNTCLKNPLATTISLYINKNVSNVSEQFSFASSLSYSKFSNFLGIFYLFFAKEFENFERIICKEKSLKMTIEFECSEFKIRFFPFKSEQLNIKIVQVLM